MSPLVVDSLIDDVHNILERPVLVREVGNERHLRDSGRHVVVRRAFPNKYLCRRIALGDVLDASKNSLGCHCILDECVFLYLNKGGPMAVGNENEVVACKSGGCLYLYIYRYIYMYVCICICICIYINM